MHVDSFVVIGSDVKTQPSQQLHGASQPVRPPHRFSVLHLGSGFGDWICSPGPRLTYHCISSIATCPSRISLLGSPVEGSERLKACLKDTQDSLGWWTQSEDHNCSVTDASAREGKSSSLLSTCLGGCRVFRFVLPPSALSLST